MASIIQSYHFFKLKIEKYREHFSERHGILVSAIMLIISVLVTIFGVLAITATVMLPFALFFGWL